MEELILAGGDTDTIASITGQITGAIIGQDGLPEEWKAKLPDREMIFSASRENLHHPYLKDSGPSLSSK